MAIDEIGDDIIGGDEIQDTLDNAEMDLLNSGMHEERISYLTDLLESVNWEGSIADNSCNYRGYIGESMNALGRYDEADEYFEKLLTEDPDNDEYVFRYVLAKFDRGDYEGARELMEKQISLDTEVTHENISLFDWAPEIYKKLGQKEKAKAFREKMEKW